MKTWGCFFMTGGKELSSVRFVRVLELWLLKAHMYRSRPVLLGMEVSAHLLMENCSERCSILITCCLLQECTVSRSIRTRRSCLVWHVIGMLYHRQITEFLCGGVPSLSMWRKRDTWSQTPCSYSPQWSLHCSKCRLCIPLMLLTECSGSLHTWVTIDCLNVHLIVMFECRSCNRDFCYEF